MWTQHIVKLVPCQKSVQVKNAFSTFLKDFFHYHRDARKVVRMIKNDEFTFLSKLSSDDKEKKVAHNL